MFTSKRHACDRETTVSQCAEQLRSAFTTFAIGYLPVQGLTLGKDDSLKYGRRSSMYSRHGEISMDLDESKPITEQRRKSL